MTPLEIVLVCVTGLTLVAFAVAKGIAFQLLISKDERYDYFNLSAKRGQVAFFGDSLIEFFPLQEFFADKLIYNRGIAADRTEHLLKRLSNVTDLAPGTLFLLIGTNDLARRKQVDWVFRSICLVIDRLQEALPDTRLYVLSLLPVSRRTRPISRLIVGRRNNADLRRINELLRDYCAERSAEYIDLHTLLADEDGNLKKEFTVEGLHLSAAGYALVAHTLRPIVEAACMAAAQEAESQAQPAHDGDLPHPVT